MDTLSPAEEQWLADLEERFFIELANHAIGSASVEYASAEQARMEMLREAYLKGRNVVAPLTFEEAVAKVDAINRSQHAEVS